jgi:hypothetical protein
MVDRFTPLRVQMSADEAWVVMAALRWYRDTYLDDDEDRDDNEAAEAAHWRYHAQRVKVRLHKQLRSRGAPVPTDE